MNSAKLLKIWHLAGMIATGAGVVAAQIAPLVSAYPKATAICLGVGAASLTVTAFMNKLANDKIVQALINDPSSPTPQGFGIPTPILEQLAPAVAVRISDSPRDAAGAAAQQNAKDFLQAVKDSTPAAVKS